MDENSERRPSIADMEALEKIAILLEERKESAATFNDLAERIGYSAQRLKKRREALTAHCGSDILVEANGRLVLSREARQLYEYVKPILRMHHAIRSWPPVHEIVIATSHRTAAAYLPTFLHRFLTEIEDANHRRKALNPDLGEGRVQITVREGDSDNLLWAQLRNREIDFVVRGLLVNSNDMPIEKIPEDIKVVPFSPPYKIRAVSQKKLPSRVSLTDLFRDGRIGILKMNLEDTVRALQGQAEAIHLPLSGTIVCESYSVLMSFIQQSICTGLVFLPPPFSLKGFNDAEVVDLNWATRAFILASKEVLNSLESVPRPAESEIWNREHYLAKFRDILLDETLQKSAIKPAFRNFPFS